MTNKQLKFSLTLEGVVDLNGMDEEDGRALLLSNLEEIIPRAAGDAHITGYTALTLETYSTEICVDLIDSTDEEDDDHDD